MVVQSGMGSTDLEQGSQTRSHKRIVLISKSRQREANYSPISFTVSYGSNQIHTMRVAHKTIVL
jgi:hypothetical protein